MDVDLEVLLTIATMALWLLFPIGLFFSVGYLDRTTHGSEQHIHLEDKLDVEPHEEDEAPSRGFHLPPWLHGGMRH